MTNHQLLLEILFAKKGETQLLRSTENALE